MSTGSHGEYRNTDASAQNVGNYPAPDDTTAEGGYGSTPDQVWSAKAQRGARRGDDNPNERPATGLVDQSLSGGNLKNEMQDAKQGVDVKARRDLNYMGDDASFENRKEAQKMLDESMTGRF